MTNANAHQPDNLFGICHRIGEDFGFNPLWLRLGLAAGFVLAPIAVVAAYFTLGGFMLLSRIVFPDRARPAATVVALPGPSARPGPELRRAA